MLKINITGKSASVALYAGNQLVDIVEDVDVVLHDIEHLIHGLGFSQAEETRIFNAAGNPPYVNERQYTAALYPQLDLREWLQHFTDAGDFVPGVGTGVLTAWLEGQTVRTSIS